MTTVIHHNPGCRASRNGLAIIRSTGTEPVVIECLKTGWTRPQLQALFAAADLTPRTALRTTRSPAAELGLLDPAVSDDALLDAMIAHPILMNRPIVCSPKGAALCHPVQAVLPLLEAAPKLPLYMEDSSLILDENGKQPAK